MNDDTISRQAAIDVVNSETVSTNPEHFKSSEKFIKFMDDTDIASFGKWQWANGFNTALVATTVQLKKLPSAERHGRWIENEFGAYCSECGLYAYRSNGIPWKSNYCPICGASIMDDNAIQHTKCVGNALDALDEVEE